MLKPGARLGPYEITALVGSGGMGEVYRARDPRLGRDVAIKVLPAQFAADPRRLHRFEHEARAAGQLNHPNILVLYDVGIREGSPFLVTELLEGETLRERLEGEGLTISKAVDVGIQIVKGLAAAHGKGIVHRDLKPSNVFLTNDDQVKLLDFGLAKLTRPEPVPGASTEASVSSTETGTLMGTVGYMSPEQVRGQPTDHRTDIFSFGCVLHEMLSGERPFRGDTTSDVMAAILKEDPTPLPARVPPALQGIVSRCLEKRREDRFSSAHDLGLALEAVSTEPWPTRRKSAATGTRAAGEIRSELKASRASPVSARLSGRARFVIAAAAVVAVAAGGWFWHRMSRARWARETATPEIARLVAAEDFTMAVALAREARKALPNDQTLKKLWMEATREISVVSVPPGAEVSYRPYRGNPRTWESLGQTPLHGIRVARNYYVWRVSKPGFAPAYDIAPTWIGPSRDPRRLVFRLDRDGSVPAGMVRVPGGMVGLAGPGLGQFPEVAVDDYLIDRCEVTNEEYRKFVDAGGYEKREFWKQPFVRDGRNVSWEDGVALFRDATGRPGPATWELGSYPRGLEKHPVAGVSWWEAAAYAEFAGKSLPTVYHWNWAAQTPGSLLFVPGSNFQGAGTVAVGGEGALSGFGTSDMAGNVKEWCWNESSKGKRFILGGGFGEPTYMFFDKDAQSPWDRRPNYGFRCVKLPSPPSEATARRIEAAFRNFSKEKPVSEEVFRAYKGLYTYDRGELNARVEETETVEDGTREKVSFNAAYSGERVIAYLYFPKDARRPFQTVVFFPGAEAFRYDKFVLSRYADFVPRSGRVLVVPIYKSTFERRDELRSDYPESTAFWRDHMIAWSKDLGRSLDYLGTRKDIDCGKLAYLGMSWGGAVAPNLLAVENRFRIAILIAGGLEFERPLPEADTINFVTRVKIPVLMLNGRYDYFFPVESSQIPLFHLLGTPEKDKRHVILESGHAPPRMEVIRESLDWLDRYLGPVKR